jgi:hypothetical protein
MERIIVLYATCVWYLLNNSLCVVTILKHEGIHEFWEICICSVQSGLYLICVRPVWCHEVTRAHV